MSVKPEKKAPEDRKIKLSRYRAGRVPDWVANHTGRDGDEEDEHDIDIKVERKNDPRIERMQKTHIDKEEAIRRRREIIAEVVAVGADQRIKEEEEENKEEEEEDEDEEPQEEVEMDIDSDDEARRERARLQYLRKKKEEEEILPLHEEGEEEEEESEYETDSEYEEDFPSRPTIQPVFVRKENRETIAQREKMDQECERLEQLRIKQLEERVQETKKMVEEEKLKEKEEAAAAEEGDDEKVLSDEEEENEAKEYELWKLREITRIRRDKEERDHLDKEREETEKRRNLSDMEIRQMDKEKFVKEKKKWKFLQKYYHKGAFFREGKEEDMQTRDYSSATGDDLIDKTLLPKVMQVKNFGRSGRTKYTHLADQDTTAWDAGWMVNDSLRVKYNQKMGGMHSTIDRPSLKRKKP